MSIPLAAGTISNTANLETSMQTDFETIVSIAKETLGGTAVATGSAYQLSGNTFTIADNLMAYQIDTNGGTASTDTLNKITAGANLRDGMVIMIQPTANNRVITVANAAGGTGQILTKDGNNKIFRDIRQWMMLKYSAGSGSWNVIFDDETFRINQLIGGANSSILTNTGTAGTITPTAAIHQVNTSVAGTQTVGNALLSSIIDVGRIIILSASNAPTNIPVLIHMNGGAGQFQMTDSTNFSLAQAGIGIMFQLRSVASVLTWVEVTRFGTILSPSNTLAGQSIIGNGLGQFVLDTPPVSSPGYCEVLDVSTNGTFNRRWQASDPGMPGGRLTCFSGSPVILNNSTSGTIYYTPYKSQYIPQWNATSGQWIPTKFPELSLSLTGLASGNYYVYVGSATLGVPALIANTTAPTMQNGALCQSGAPANLYVGVMYTNSNLTFNIGGSVSGSTIIGGTLGLRNYYHRFPCKVRTATGSASSASYTYASSTFRAMGGGAPGVGLVGHPSVCGRDYAIAKVSAVWKTSTSADTPIFGACIGNSSFAPLKLGQEGGLIFPSTALALTTTDYLNESTVDLCDAITFGQQFIYPVESMPAGTLTVYSYDSTTGTASCLSLDTDF